MMADTVLAAELVKDKFDTLMVVVELPIETKPEPDEINRPDPDAFTLPLNIKMPEAPFPPRPVLVDPPPPPDPGVLPELAL